MKYKVTLKGVTYEVEVEKGEAILLDEYEAKAPAAPAAAAPAPAAAAPAAAPAAPAAPAAATGKGDPVVSPLPGTVLDVKVTVGQAVKAGDVVMLVEAMKMENEIPAPKDGTVTAIVAPKGTKVDTGSVLLTIA